MRILHYLEPVVARLLDVSRDRNVEGAKAQVQGDAPLLGLGVLRSLSKHYIVLYNAVKILDTK